MLLERGLHENGFLKVLNLWMLAPLSRLAFIIGAWLVLEWISKNFEFVGFGSAVEVGFDYRSFVKGSDLYHNGFVKGLDLREWALLSSFAFCYRVLVFMRMDI